MKQSSQRILTTHTGSLPRPYDLQQMLEAQDRGEPVDHAIFETRVEEAVSATVQQEASCGIDVINDGEMSKISYSTYVKDRLTGFEGRGFLHIPPKRCTRLHLGISFVHHREDGVMG
jgi:5-methyltetrahydropteroyltriglutamate--homocysteine methyltransferase